MQMKTLSNIYDEMIRKVFCVNKYIDCVDASQIQSFLNHICTGSTN